LAEVHGVGGAAEQPVEQRAEVAGHLRLGEVVALALDDVGGEVRRWVGRRVSREEGGVADEQASDRRVLVGRDGRA
jgi:hypothetical protein